MTNDSKIENELEIMTLWDGNHKMGWKLQNGSGKGAFNSSA